MLGLISLIVRTIVLNPMIVAGIALACYYKFTYSWQVIKLIFTAAWVPYAIMVGIALAYTLLFKHVYYPNSKRINWWATTKSSVFHFLTIALVVGLTLLILHIWDSSSAQNLDDYLRYKKR